MDFANESEAIRKRASLKRALTRLEKYLKNIDFSKNELILRQGILNDTWNDFKQVQSYLEIKLDSKPVEEHDAESDQFESRYCLIGTRLQDLIDNCERPPTPDNVSVRSDRSTTNLKLPPIDLPTFSGEFTKFMSYKATFESLVINNIELDNVQRLHYLLSSLQGEPRELLANISISDNNFLVCWNLVLDRYDNKRIIISQHIKQFLELHHASSGSCSDYRKLLNQIKSNLNAIEVLKCEVPLHELLLSDLILFCIKPTHRNEWENRAVADVPRLNDLLDFLERKCQALELSEVRKIPVETKTKVKAMCITNSPASSYCCYCNRKNHDLIDCNNFVKLNVDARRKFVNENKLCFKCFSSRHSAKRCNYSACSACKRNHNILVHKDLPSTNNSRGENSIVATHASMKTAAGLGTNVLLSTACVKVKGRTGRVLVVKALLDSGSQLSFVTSSLVERLGLQTKSCNLPISGIENINPSPISATCNIKMMSQVSDFALDLNCAVVQNVTSQLPVQKIDPTTWNIPNDITLSDTTFYEPSRIDILVGADAYHEIILMETLTRKGHPTLLNTRLGWILAGRFPITSISTTNKPRQVNFVKFNSLEATLQKFWELEEISHPILTPEEKACEKWFVETTTRDESGKFVVRLPRRLEVPPVAESRAIAVRRLKQMERKFERSITLKEDYIEFMKEYGELSHMEIIAEQKPESLLSYYLPHHCVLKESSTTTKLRVVFDGSCESSNSISLNSMLMVGPIVQPDLLSIVMKFRSYYIALSADIAKMYRCIMVHPDDRDLQRIVWRDSVDQEIKDYRLTTVTYGTSPASFLACRCLNWLADEHQETHPYAAEVIRSCFYVDDLMSGSSTVDKAQQLQNELTHVLGSAHFHLRKWASNSAEALRHVPDEDKENLSPCSLTNEETIKTLGIVWHPKSDKFQVQTNLKKLPTIVTKRVVLAIVASIYDPLGLLGPAIIKCKLILQSLWQLKIDWDESFESSSLFTQWKTIHSQLPCLNEIQVDRKVLPFPSTKKIEVHGFCDSSESAYGACVYVRSLSDDNRVSTVLLASKSRVAPLKKQTIARLELCAAVLLSQLMKKVIEALKLPSTAGTFYWCDSTIVLCWLQRPPHHWKTFVGNRVAEVQSNTCVSDWRHVSGEENPADCLSRGVHPSELVNLHQWWNGPSWLLNHEPTYNDFVISDSSEPASESKPQLVSMLTRPADVLQFEKFSTWLRLLKVYAYVLRFIHNTKVKGSHREERRRGPLTPLELNIATQKILTTLQHIEYPQETRDLKKNNVVQNNSKLKPLNPFLDENETLRVGGRLENAEMSYDEKHPIIVPPRHHVTTLLVKHEHETLLHSGIQSVLFSLRNRYWIPNGKTVVRKVVSNCYRCFRMKPPQTTHLMGQLPEYRVKPSAPFTETGVDYAGPILIKGDNPRSRIKFKSYIALFVCMSTKAIHLELVKGLSTADFLAALKRFISRRGKPSCIHSDNGTNFVGANNELQKFFKETSKDIVSYASIQAIDWKFIPPSSPHFGGVWEAGVKSVKSHLSKTIGQSILSFEEMSTFLCQVEAVLNSRPMCSLPDSFDTFPILSPGHFLIGRALTAIPEPNLVDVPLNHLSRWQLVQQMLQSFWKRWSGDYLHTLQQRRKWSSPGAWNPAVGDLVLLREDNLPPMVWRTGVIVKLHPGSDNITRVASVETIKGTFKRSLVKLCPLP